MIEEARTRIPADTDDADLKALSENLIAWEKTLGAVLDENNVYQNNVEPVNNGTSEYLLVQMISFGGDSINTVLESKSLEPIQDTFGAEIKEEMPNFNIIGGVSALQTPSASTGCCWCRFWSFSPATCRASSCASCPPRPKTRTRPATGCL